MNTEEKIFDSIFRAHLNESFTPLESALKAEKEMHEEMMKAFTNIDAMIARTKALEEKQ